MTAHPFSIIVRDRLRVHEEFLFCKDGSPAHGRSTSNLVDSFGNLVPIRNDDGALHVGGGDAASMLNPEGLPQQFETNTSVNMENGLTLDCKLLQSLE